MGAFLDKPKTDKHNEKGEGNGLKYGLSSMQGWRVEMEDAHTAVIGLKDLPLWSFFAVFDGHAGANVSVWCAERLLSAITATFARDEGAWTRLVSVMEAATETASPEASPDKEAIELLTASIKEGFLSLDAQIRNLPDVASGVDKSGSTASGVLITPCYLVFANCGDSRGVLSRGTACHFHTHDHKPGNPIEKERIQRAGGSVMIQRVNGSLAVSRALGDYEYKRVDGKGPTEQLVSPEPEISAIVRNDSQDEFILLACDGIWDVMTNDEACDYARYLMRLSGDLEWVCNKLIDCCLHKGSRDNMSVEIIALPGAPTVSEEAKSEDIRLNRHLEETIIELYMSSQDGVDLFNTHQYLLNADIKGLPPGGGLAAKYSEIENFYNSVTKDKDQSSPKFSSQQPSAASPLVGNSRGDTGGDSPDGEERAIEADADMSSSKSSADTPPVSSSPSESQEACSVASPGGAPPGGEPVDAPMS